MIEIGKKAPEFTLCDEKGNIVSLSSFLGKKVVLYFYPKDDTSGCTQEALMFKDLVDEFKKENAIVIGISKDSAKSHLKFKEKYLLPFILLVDEETKVSSLYDVYKEKSMYGRKYMGIERSTFIIDEEGILISAEYKVKPKESPVCSLNFIKNK